MTYFTDLEVATLDKLYDQLDEWWHFFYILSDAVEEREPLAADGMRWLCQVRQRPSGDFINCKFVWWAVPLNDYGVKLFRHYLKHNSENNYLPHEFAAICNGYTTRDYFIFRLHDAPDAIRFSTPTRGLQAALCLWTTFDDETRQQLWKLTDSQ